MRYPETVNLPFNATAVRNSLRLLPPDESISEEHGVYAVIRGGSLVVRDENGSFALPDEIPAAWLSGASAPLLIGRRRGLPLRVLRIGRDAVVEPPLTIEPINLGEDRLGDELLSIAGLAQQIIHWEEQSRFCPHCGSATARIAGSWGRRCLSCAHERYPAIHPCAIVLVKRGDEFLLVRKADWAPGRYSLVAGFLDIGESLEECAVREVREETGIEVTNVRYVGSQSWPFPTQLMAGFLADYVGGEIVVESAELESARWFCADRMPDALPSMRSIARWIIDHHAVSTQR